LWLLKHKDDAFNELEIRLVQQGSESVCDRDSTRLNRAVQAQVEELGKTQSTQMTSSVQFLMNCGHHGQHKMAIFLCYISVRTARWHNKTSPSLSTNFARRSVREINLINDLLDLQRLETGTDNVRRNSPTFLLEVIEPFNVSQSAANALTFLPHLLRSI